MPLTGRGEEFFRQRAEEVADLLPGAHVSIERADGTRVDLGSSEGMHLNAEDADFTTSEREYPEAEQWVGEMDLDAMRDWVRETRARMDRELEEQIHLSYALGGARDAGMSYETYKQAVMRIIAARDYSDGLRRLAVFARGDEDDEFPQRWVTNAIVQGARAEEIAHALYEVATAADRVAEESQGEGERLRSLPDGVEHVPLPEGGGDSEASNDYRGRGDELRELDEVIDNHRANIIELGRRTGGRSTE